MSLSSNIQDYASNLSLTARTDLLHIFPLNVQSTEYSEITSLDTSKSLYPPGPKHLPITPKCIISIWNMPSMTTQDVKTSGLYHFVLTDLAYIP